MTNDEWDTIALLLHRGFKWKEPFAEAHELAYQTLLDGYSAEQIADVLRALVARGQVFGPTPGEIVQLIRHDSSAPTFVEAFRLIYGKGGILKARPEYKPGGWHADDLAEATKQLQLQRASEMHPLVESFMLRYGLDRLKQIPLDDPDYGEVRRRELEDAWNQHCEATEDRDLAVLVQGRRGAGLSKLDPLAALEHGRTEIGSGS